MVVFGESGFVRAKLLYSGKSSCIHAKWLYSGKSGCIPAKVGVNEEKWLYCFKVVELVQGGLYRAKWL